VIRLKETTVMEVTARLFFLQRSHEIGIGATSMFLYSKRTELVF
jgi:glucan biosynthesis protein